MYVALTPSCGRSIQPSYPALTCDRTQTAAYGAVLSFLRVTVPQLRGSNRRRVGRGVSGSQRGPDAYNINLSKVM
jgi:hypothetical protein